MVQGVPSEHPDDATGLASPEGAGEPLPALEFSLLPHDAQALAALHLQAFPTFFLSSLGERFLAEFYRGFVGDPTAVVVVQRGYDGRPVGVVVGTTEPAGFFSRLLRRRLWGFVRAAAIASMRNPRVVPRLLRGVTYRGEASAAARGALLSSICVAPELSGGGHGRRLIDAWKLQARALGAASAHLTTDAADNDRVNRFYVADGWLLSGSFTTPEGRKMNLYTVELTGTSNEQSKDIDA
ncbi:MAG: GNAT family N-acetyltransferase [Propionicimonas sp.]